MNFLKSKKGITCIRAFLLLAAVGMIAAGILRQEPATVLKKAVRICLECIGVG